MAKERPSRQPLTDSEIKEALTGLPGWTVEDGKFHKRYEFKDFVEAMGWMVSVALEAEKLDHHPDWSNNWNKVDVTLYTHSEKALTGYDVALAEKMEELG